MTTATTTHETSTVEVDGWYRRVCSCGYASATFRSPPGTEAPCPRDETVTALVTLQMHWGGLLDSTPADDYAVHLVRSTACAGTPGPTLCGIDRFAPDAPGWSVGGGISGPGVQHQPCSACAEVARTEFAGLPIVGSIGAREMAAAVGAEVAK